MNSNFYTLPVTTCTTSLTFNNCTLCHTVFMHFVFIWEQTAKCATYSINWLYIFNLPYISFNTTYKFEFTATCFDLTSHLQAYLQTLSSYNLPVRIWDPRWLTMCVRIQRDSYVHMYYSIYVCTGGDACAAVWGRCSRGPGCVRCGFPSSRF